MAPAIRVSDENYNRLKKWAIPFEDSPNDALGKILDAAESAGLRASSNESGNSRLKHNSSSQNTVTKLQNKRSKVSQEAYESAILGAIYELGGKAKVSEVLHKVEEKMRDFFGVLEYQRPPTGTEVRWRNTARWARAALVNRGLINRGSPRGIWQLTADGLAEAEAMASAQGSG